MNARKVAMILPDGTEEVFNSAIDCAKFVKIIGISSGSLSGIYNLLCKNAKGTSKSVFKKQCEFRYVI